MVLAERKGDIIAAEIQKLAPIRVAATAFLLLGGPFPCCASIVLPRDQIAIEELAKDKLAADVKVFRENFGRPIGWRLARKSRLERFFRHKKLRCEAIAQHFDVPGPLGRRSTYPSSSGSMPLV